MEFINHKISIPKHKGKTFQELAIYILQEDKKYISVLFRTLNNPKTSQEKKTEISNFINFFTQFEKNYNPSQTQIQTKSQPENIWIPPQITINTNITHISHIFHISDIHIRLYQREKEYEDVFAQLYKYIQKKSTGHEIIVITGDLLHSKNQLSPECILITQNFLINLSKICPTFLIAGNHDALLNNNQRQDSITAIVEKANIPNFHYLKNSAVYYFSNLSISVNSLLDNQWIHANSFQPPPHIHHKIALYHGGVGLVETGVGHRLKGEKLIDDFQGYDFTLLGDIHKYQWLIPKRMAYASSLIAQNFSEWNHPHGVLIWDLQQLNHHYHPIPNNSGFFVFNLLNNQLLIQEQIISPNDIPNYLQSISSSLNVKLNIRNCSHDFISSISHSISKCAKNTRIIHNHLSSQQSNNPINQHLYTEGANYNTQQLQSLLLQHIQETHPNLSQSDKEFILQKYQEISSNSAILHEKNLSKWELIDIKFSNLFGYGSNNYINFQQFSSESPIGIIAPNSHGKSSLIDIILFTLFSKFSRSRGTAISKDIINIHSNEFQSTIKFKIGTDIYTIHKEGKREQNNRIKITKNTFHKNQENLSDENRIKTDKIITNLIGNYEDMVFTNIQLQNKHDSFKDMSDKERKEHLYKILKLDIWNNIITQMKETTKPIKSQINYLEKRIENTDLQNVKNLIQDSNIQISLLNDTIEQQLYEKQINLEKIQELTSQIQTCSAEKYNLQNIHQKIDELTNSISPNSSQLSSANSLLNEMQTKISSLSLIEQKDTIIDDYNKQLKKHQNNISNLENKISNISLLSLIPTSQFQKKFPNTKNLITNIQNNIDKINIQSIQDEISNLQNDLQTEINKQSNIKTQIEILQSQISHSNYSLSTLQKNEKELNKKISNKIKEQKIVKDKINNLEIQLQNYNLQKLEYFKNELPKHSQISNLTNQKTNLLQILKNLDTHEYDPNCKFCMKYPITQQKIQTADEIQSINNQINEIQQSLSIPISEKENYEKHCEEVDELNEKINLKKQKLPVLENTITKYELDLEKIKAQISLINQNNNLTKQISSLQTSFNPSSISCLQSQISSKKSLLNQSQSKLQELITDKETATSYINILEQNKEINKNNEILISQINNLKNEISFSKKEWEKSTIFSQYVKLQEELQQQNELQNNIHKLQISIQEYQFNLQKNKELLQQNKQILQDINNAKITLENNNKIRNLINQLQHKIDENDTIISHKNSEIGKINQLITSNKDNVKEYVQMTKELENIKKEYNLLKILEDSLNKDGLPLRILNHFLPPITQQINNIISPFISRKIDLKIENDDLILESYPTQDADKSVFMHGGMESFILDIAFKITLSNFAKLPKCNILFLDEGISAFDSERLSNIDILFSFISNYFNKTILITHIDSVKDNIQEKITISKINDKSSITCEYLN